MFKFIVFAILIIYVNASTEYLNSDEHYGLHTQAIPSGHGPLTAHGSNDEPTNQSPLVTEDPEEDDVDDESQEDVEPQHIVQYIRVKYIPQPVYKYVQATSPPPQPPTPVTPIPTTSTSVQESIVKYIPHHRQRLVKYIPAASHQSTQVIKYMPATATQRVIKLVPQRIVKVPQRIVKVLKYVPYNPEHSHEQQQHHQHIQKVTTYKATPAPHHQQQYIPHTHHTHHHVATVTVPAYHTDQVILTGPAYEHTSISRRSHHHEQSHEHEQH